MTIECSGDSELSGLLTDAGLDTVDGAFAYGGGQDLVKPGLGTRRRTRIELPGPDGTARVLYLKRYGPERLGDCWKRFVTYGRCSPASVEFDNIRAAQQCGVSTMDAVAFGHEMGPCGLSGRRSYLVVTSVPGDALERCGAGFLVAHAGDDGADRLTAELARQIAALHAGGLVHRDMYAAHIFLHETPDGMSLYMIDMARVFAPRWRMFRWRVKDLAQLKYSMPEDWVRDCWDAFLDVYLEKCPGDRRRYSRAIDCKVASILQQTRRRAQRRDREASQR
ncbi:MAG: lipopolysaccharide kinase InaA family protein [Phycisphaerae bacterium]|jgi:tRNA A-37 threonylcarbamoyl transferase component Bud32|nr:lipopolysaccharide kinase InaA family protein [Phycisphaerae bacterium]MDP7289889.1 lipopolysaccharide kinase InaA family protein [Phycisphaerae bacterium]